MVASPVCIGASEPSFEIPPVSWASSSAQSAQAAEPTETPNTSTAAVRAVRRWLRFILIPSLARMATVGETLRPGERFP